MSILIKGMEMPTSCRACLYSRTDIRNVDWCVLTEKDLPCECPIVPVPPHGALIDRDDFFAECPELVNGYKAITDDLVVVQAEEKGENFCADCHWYESEQQYCFRNGCHAYNESTCEHWEPMPADEPIPAEEET